MDAPRRLRAYRVLLRLFPAGFRRAHGPHMERLFADMIAEWEGERGSAGPAFWASLVWDTTREASTEWLSLLGNTLRSATALTVGEHMSALVGDIRFAIRQLVRQPLYSGMIVLLMALGIAGNAAVFRVFNGLFLKPLPFDRPEQLVDIDETAPTWDLEFLSVAYRDFAAWRESNSTFQSMAAYDFGGGTLVTPDGAYRVSYLSVTHDIDEVLGIEASVGRFFGPEEDHPDGPRGGLITRGLWEQRWGGDPAVIGQTMLVNGFSIEILGVLPPEAELLGDADIWFPLRSDRDDWNGWGLNAIGRLNEGATIEQARADLMTIHKGMIPEFEVNEISSPVVNSLRDRYLGDYRLGSGFLLGAVGIVLLIACANIAGLMTARSLSRGPEIGVRRAMGAPRGRIIRQLLTESMVLSVVGAGLGAAVGIWGSDALVGPLADQFPNWVSFDLDGRFLTFTLLVTVGAAVLFGLAPALQASDGALGSGTTRTTASGRRRRGMNMLVTGQVAMALALLVVGALSVLDVRRLGRADPGFDADGLVSFSMSLPSQRYADAPARLAFHERYLERLGSVPGVESAAVTSALPLGGHWGWFYLVDGAPARGEDETNPVVLTRFVSSSYFETVGVRFAAGQAFDQFSGRDDGEQVIIVNETFVRTHLSHLENPLGARLFPGTDLPEDEAEARWLTVVGVTRDVKHYGMDVPMRPGVYRPLPELPLSSFQVALKIRGDLGPIMSEVRSVTAEVDAELPVYNVETMTEELHESLYTRRATSWLIGIFSTVALLMAIAGIYGVISYSVGQRRQEISIRMAMGAEARTVLREVVGQGMRLVALGAIIGLGVSLAGASVVSGILVGVSPTNPAVYGAVTIGVLAVAAAANYLPARRAARLDPMGALRGE